MTDDVMARLMAVEALPRGERLARYIETVEPDNCIHDDLPLWDVLFDGSRTLNALDNLFSLDDVYPPRCVPLTVYADRWRSYAAPLRKAREELRKLRDEIMFVEDVALKFQGENEELLLENARLLKQFMQVKKDSP